MGRYPSALQILVYVTNIVLVPLTVFLTSAFVFPYCSLAIFLCGIILISLLVTMHFANSIMIELLEKRKHGFKPLPYVSRPNCHVIENEFCQICQIQAPKGTKHCRQCNACIAGFDHHCTWLNACIGSRNYRLFIVFVFYIAFNSLLHVICFLTMLILWTTNSTTLLSKTTSFTIDLVFYPNFNSILWLIICVLILFFSIIIFASSSHLLWFHVKLYKNGQSTYNYILDQRNKMRDKTTETTTESVRVHHLQVDVLSEPQRLAVPSISDRRHVGPISLPPVRVASHPITNRIYPQTLPSVSSHSA